MCSDVDRSDNIQMRREKKFALVQFILSKKAEQPIVDLVLSSWINEESQTCFYPRKKDHAKIYDWIQKCQDPDNSWLKNQKIQIIRKYRSFQKAKRGLDKYLLTLELGDTTESMYSENPDEQSESSARNKTIPAQKKNPVPVMEVQGILPKSTKRRTDSTVSGKKDVKRYKKIISDFERTIMKDIEKTFNSIIYDIDDKFAECERKLILNFGRPLGKGISEEKAKLRVSLPISDVNTFQEFNVSLRSDVEKLAALKAIMMRYAPKTSINDAVIIILPKIMTKSVQLQYSLTGKSSKTQEKKLKFNETAVYTCLKDVLCNRFGIDETNKEIGKRISRWLIGASDREGGKKMREAPANPE